MSVTDPLLKQLKGHAAKLLNESTNGAITDKSAALLPFCETLETIYLQGLIENFPLRRAECWFWMENITSPRFQTAFTYCTAVNSVRESLKVSTHRGYFRLLIRMCLVRGCIHVPVEKLVHMTSSSWRTYQPDSILGDEILGEILLSVLLQCSKLKFHLHLENAAFLDETWQLGQYEKLEIVPCKSLGICVGFAYGKAVVVRVDPSSVSAEDDKIVVGDVIDEINGYAVTASMRSKLSSIMRQATGKPIMLSIIKAKLSNGNIYSPLRKLYLKLGLNSQELQEVKNSQDVKAAIGEEHKAGFAVDFVGEVVIGEKGDVAQIAGAITKALSGVKRPAQLEILEMGVRVTDRQTEKIVAKHSYMEISSCGRQERLPYFFAYIAGDCSCNVASEFTCYVFHSRDEDQIVNILHSIAQGFQRTHWAV